MYIFLYFVGLFTFLLSRASLYIFGGDSAEFSLVGSMWGIAHPPGYPFYTLLSNIIVRIIPFYTIPWRISIISVLATVLTAFFIYKILKLHVTDTFICLVCATLYIFLYPVFLYALVPEVFALHTFLVSLTTYLVFLFTKNKKLSYLFTILFLIGVQISHHHIFILMVPAWAYLLIKNRILIFIKKQKKSNIVIAFFLLILGISFYLYPPIVSKLGTVADWENAQSLQGFFRLITRAMYGTFKAYSGSSGNIPNQFFDIFSFVVFVFQDYRLPGLIFIILGLLNLNRNNKPLFAFVMISISAHIVFYFYTNFNLSRAFTLAMFERFLIPLYFLLIIPFTFGFLYIRKEIVRITDPYIKNASIKRYIRFSLSIFLILLVVLVAIQNLTSLKYVRKLSIFDTYAKDLLNTPPNKAVVQIGLDNSNFPSSYLYFKEKYRPDLIFPFFILIGKPHYQQIMKKRYPSLFIPKQPVNSSKFMPEFLSHNNKNGLYFETPVATDSWRPYGLLWKYYSTDTEMKKDEQNLLIENKKLWNSYSIPVLSKEMQNILHAKDVQDEYISAYMDYSKLLVETGHLNDAEIVVKKVFDTFRSSDFNTKTILINILVEEKKCKQATQYIKTVPFEKMTGSWDYLQSYHSYYTLCEPNNIRKQLLLEKLEKLRNQNEKLRQNL